MPIDDSSSSMFSESKSVLWDLGVYGCADRGRGIGLYSGDDCEITIMKTLLIPCVKACVMCMVPGGGV